VSFTLPDARSTELDAEAARELTTRIKVATADLCRLLVEAHDRRAWRALGYESWERYVTVEFHMSRQRAYQLLDQAVVIDKVRAAAELSTPVDITEAAARDLKPHLAEVVAEITERTTGLPDDAKPAVVAEVIQEQRKRPRERRPSELRADAERRAQRRADKVVEAGGRILERMENLTEQLSTLDIAVVPRTDSEGWIEKCALCADRLSEFERRLRHLLATGEVLPVADAELEERRRWDLGEST
jgi:hypothetical protein